jgi:hypothetical protein
MSRICARSGSPDYSDATRDDQLGRQALHHLVSLIARHASYSGDSSIWPGSRGSIVQDFAFNLKSITGPGRIWPIKLTASPDDTASERQAALDQEAHGDRSRVPTTCRQARKHGVLGGLVIKVEGLRIELTGKSFDLLLIDDMGSARKALPDLEIIEIEPIVVAEFLHGLCLRALQGPQTSVKPSVFEKSLIIKRIFSDSGRSSPMRKEDGRPYDITARRGGKGADQRDIRPPEQSCRAYDPPFLLRAPLPRDQEKVSSHS